MITDLVIKDCDKKFADMVKKLHKLYAKRLKFSFEANFSGNINDFKYYFSKIDIDELLNVYKHNEGESRNEVL